MTDRTAEPRWFFANLVRVVLPQETTGRMSIIELAGPPGDMPPLHLHQADDEAWYVLEGEMSFFVENSEPIRIGARSLAFGPKGVPHTYRVEGERDAHWLAVCTPGDFERFVIAASRPAERDELPPHGDPPSEEQIVAITTLAAEHGIELLGPPGALP